MFRSMPTPTGAVVRARISRNHVDRIADRRA